MHINSTNQEELTFDLVDLIEKPAWKSILYDLVGTEKMDPWSINISELAEKYLQKINALESTDLRIPANAILCSAILLKIKSRILKVTHIEDEEELLEKKKMEAEREKDLRLLEQLPELKAIHKMKEGKVTLDELVDQIEAMLEKTKKKKSDTRFLDRPEFHLPITNFNIDEKMNEVYTCITEKADSQGMTLFRHLVKENNTTEIVETFIPVLFLANNGKINAWQDEFFGEIFLQILKQ
jgi:segregation and condensation protein A